MNSVEFIAFTLEHWLALTIWCFSGVLILLFLFYKLAPAKIYDPLNFYLSFNLGTGYGVLCCLFQFGEVNISMFYMLLFFAATLLVSFLFLLKHPIVFFPKFYQILFRPIKTGQTEFYIVLAIYIFFSGIIILNTGLGALADTNRFEQARGFGMFIRVLDFFHLIILAYLALLVINIPKNSLKWFSVVFSLILFLIFSSLMGGAKFAFLEGLYVMAVAVYAYGKTIKLNIIMASLLIGFSTLFALIILNLNSRNKDVADKGLYNDDNSNILIESLISRVIANGDSYYGSLPNNVINKLRTDNILIRFIAPIIGVSQTSKIVGYKVEDYSVGRAILMYHDPANDISGGPVSHFDIFAYVYFGWFGFIFIFLLVVIIASVANALNKNNKNLFYISVLAALWLRCLAMLLEPSVGFAYVLDAIVLISFVKLLALLLLKTSNDKLSY